MARIIKVNSVYWDEEEKRWIDKNMPDRKSLLPEQITDILNLFELEFLHDIVPARVLVGLSPQELLAEKKRSLIFIPNKEKENDPNFYTVYFWDYRAQEWLRAVIPKEKKCYLLIPQPLSPDCLKDFLEKVGASHLIEFVQEEKFLETINKVPPWKITDFRYKP